MSMIRSAGHILLASIFVARGADSFLKPGGRVAMVANAGIPAPEQAVALNGAAMVVGGTALALGFAPKLAAIILLGTMIPTTLVGHAFWKEEEQAKFQNQLTQFYKNLGLIGGILLVIAEKD